ncbi:MAG: hypothetical protein R2752_12095 [Vicinamibacterales bacterium]
MMNVFANAWMRQAFGLAIAFSLSCAPAVAAFCPAFCEARVHQGSTPAWSASPHEGHDSHTVGAQPIVHEAPAAASVGQQHGSSHAVHATSQTRPQTDVMLTCCCAAGERTLRRAVAVARVDAGTLPVPPATVPAEAPLHAARPDARDVAGHPSPGSPFLPRPRVVLRV